MKRSKQIQLVLITAALASCNRTILPSQSLSRDSIDSSLIASPHYDYDQYYNNLNSCCQQVFSQLWNYSFNPFINYYTGPIAGSYYYPGKQYRKGSFWRNGHFIVRGGWGKASNSSGS